MTPAEIVIASNLLGILEGAILVCWLWARSRRRRRGPNGYIAPGSYVGTTPEDAEFARQVDREHADAERRRIDEEMRPRGARPQPGPSPFIPRHVVSDERVVVIPVQPDDEGFA